MNEHVARLVYGNFERLPHRALTRAAAAASRVPLPGAVIRAAVRLWTRYGQLDVSDFSKGPFSTMEEVFLRRLEPGRRNIGEGIVSPVDGVIVGAGEIAPEGLLEVKGQKMSLRRLVGGEVSDPFLPSSGSYAVIFLSPSGYHWIHMPISGRIIEHRWIDGEYLPQNPQALNYVRRVHERNARVALTCRSDQGEDFVLVMIGASFVGSMTVLGLTPPPCADGAPQPCELVFQKGDALGYFTIGSTVVLLSPRPMASLTAPQPLARVKMGETLFRAAT